MNRPGRIFLICISVTAALSLTSALRCCSHARAAEFMAGADVSAVGVLENYGAVYRDAGQAGDVLEMFSEHGVNWFRLRMFVNPSGQDVVVNDLAYTLQLAQRAKAAGGKVLLDLHYSDTWADPAHQAKPAAWSTLSATQLQQRVHDYTRDVVQAFRNEGLTPEMVQIGNEISNGLLWNDGYPWSGGSNSAGFDKLAALLKAGISGAKASADAEPLILLHHDQGAKWSTTSYYFDKLVDRDVDFDVIGYSYYPKWHYNPATGGGSIEDLQENLNNTAAAYGKPVVVVETGFPSRGAQFEPQYEFPVSAAGQQQFLEAVVESVRQIPNGMGQGAFWWYPEARPVNGLNVWEGGRYGWFDAAGNLLPAITAFADANPRPGDFNHDGVVDAADLSQWQQEFGPLSSGPGADSDGDGDVDGGDFLTWQTNLVAPGAGGASASIPEPAATILLSPLGIWIAAARIRQRKLRAS